MEAFVFLGAYAKTHLVSLKLSVPEYQSPLLSGLGLVPNSGIVFVSCTNQPSVREVR